MAGDLAYKPPLLVEIHPLQVGLVVCEDLIGLWYDPDLPPPLSVLLPLDTGFSWRAGKVVCAYLGAVIFDCWPW